MAHAKFRYADHPHARILRIDTSKARALDGVFAVITQDDVPDVRHGAFVQDRTLFARDVVRYEGDVIAAVAALTPEIAERAAALIDVEYEVLPAVGRLEAAALEPRRAARSIPTGSPTRAPRTSSARATSARARPSSRATPTPPWRRPTSWSSERYEADMSHAVPIEPHAVVAPVAGRQGDDLVVDPGAVHRPRRRRDHARDARVPRPRDRALPGRRVRREVRVPLRGAHRGAGPRRRPARCGSCSRRERGVRGARPPPRGPGDRARDRRHAATARSSPAAPGWCSTTAPTRPTPRSSRSWRR